MTVETKEQGFTQERLDLVKANKLHYSDLNSTEREQIKEFKTTGKIESTDTDAVTSEPTVMAQAVEPTAQETEHKKLKEKLFATQVEANKAKQLNEKLASDKAFIEKQLSDSRNAPVTQRTEDAFDDDSQKNLIERLNLLEGRERERLERDQTHFNTTQAETADLQAKNKTQSDMLAIQQLQNNFQELKTTVPITQLDAELETFAEAIGGYDNVNKYLEDPEFKKTKEAEGLTPLTNAFMENLDKFNKVVEISREYNVEKDDNGKSYSDRNPDVSIDNLYMNRLQSSGHYSDQLRNAKLTGANAVADKVVSQKYTATTMQPSTGADLPSEGMTAARAAEIMRRISPLIGAGKELSSEDRDAWDKTREFLKNSAYNR